MNQIINHPKGKAFEKKFKVSSASFWKLLIECRRSYRTINKKKFGKNRRNSVRLVGVEAATNHGVSEVKLTFRTSQSAYWSVAGSRFQMSEFTDLGKLLRSFAIAEKKLQS